MKHSKRFNAIEKNKEQVTVSEAAAIIKSGATCKFDETIDVSFDLNILKKHNIRDTVTFKNNFGKEKKVLVFAKGKKAEDAKGAGADFVGDDDLIQKISDGWLDFDATIATPDMMKSIAKIARVLGTRGLMPNPKAKTVTEDVAAAINEVKAGRREYRADGNGVINIAIGKASMDHQQVTENFQTLYHAINKKKPSDLKGDYIKSIYMTSTMGKAVKLNKKNLFK
jgi:large subunit ribosomal protein L1